MIRVTWLRPIASGTVENLLSYNISVVQGSRTFYDILDDSTTVYVITDLAPGEDYTIQVCVCTCMRACMMYVHVCAHMCTCVLCCVYVRECMCVCACVCVRMRTHVLCVCA